jgi:hypothetical protein
MTLTQLAPRAHTHTHARQHTRAVATEVLIHTPPCNLDATSTRRQACTAPPTPPGVWRLATSGHTTTAQLTPTAHHTPRTSTQVCAQAESWPDPVLLALSTTELHTSSHPGDTHDHTMPHAPHTLLTHAYCKPQEAGVQQPVSQWVEMDKGQGRQTPRTRGVLLHFPSGFISPLSLPGAQLCTHTGMHCQAGHPTTLWPCAHDPCHTAQGFERYNITHAPSGACAQPREAA